MSQLVESIVSKNHNVSKELFEQHMEELVQSKLNEVKKMIAARMDEESLRTPSVVHAAKTILDKKHT